MFKTVEEFVFIRPGDALDKIREIGAKNVKFEMLPFTGIQCKNPEYHLIKEEGTWYVRLCQMELKEGQKLYCDISVTKRLYNHDYILFTF